MSYIRHIEIGFIEPGSCHSLLVVPTFLFRSIKHRLSDPHTLISSLKMLVVNASDRHLDIDGQFHRFLDGLRARVNSFAFVERPVKSFDDIVSLVNPDTDRGTIIIGHGRTHAGLQDNAADHQEVQS